MICNFYLPYWPKYGFIYRMSKYDRNMFFNFLIFLVGDCKTEQLLYDTDNQYLEWDHHIDINCIFPDFFLTFGEISNFPDPYKKLLTFCWLFKIFTFSWLFPDLWEPCCMVQHDPVITRSFLRNTRNTHSSSLSVFASPGPRFNIKMTSYQYRKSHCGDKTILRPSYLHNGISYTGKTTSLYWIRAQGMVYVVIMTVTTWCC